VASDRPENVVDFKYLEDFAAGDMRVVTEVLALFRDQAQAWSDSLAVSTEGWAETLHTIKGASRGVGAFALGEAAEQAERLGPSVLSLVRAELQAAVADIEGYLTRVGGG
jgi:HPt (histidine-containing phosphotransfer) domain-containing protein